MSLHLGSPLRHKHDSSYQGPNGDNGKEKLLGSTGLISQNISNFRSDLFVLLFSAPSIAAKLISFFKAVIGLALIALFFIIFCLKCVIRKNDIGFIE